MSLKLTVVVDDTTSEKQLQDFVREQVRPLVREVVAEKLTTTLVEKVVANFLITDGVRRVAEQLKYRVAQEILKDPSVTQKLERLDALANDAVQNALNDKNLRPLIDSAVRRAVGSLLVKG